MDEETRKNVTVTRRVCPVCTPGCRGLPTPPPPPQSFPVACPRWSAVPAHAAATSAGDRKHAVRRRLRVSIWMASTVQNCYSVSWSSTLTRPVARRPICVAPDVWNRRSRSCPVWSRSSCRLDRRRIRLHRHRRLNVVRSWNRFIAKVLVNNIRICTSIIVLAYVFWEGVKH